MARISAPPEQPEAEGPRTDAATASGRAPTGDGSVTSQNDDPGPTPSNVSPEATADVLRFLTARLERIHSAFRWASPETWALLRSELANAGIPLEGVPERYDAAFVDVAKARMRTMNDWLSRRRLVSTSTLFN
jgi:hypothetical protein